MTIALFINSFINRYIILYDTENLLTKANISITEICAKKREIKINNSLCDSDLTSVKEINKEKNNSIYPESKEEIVEKKEKVVNQKENIENKIYDKEQNYKYETTIEKIDNKNKENSS